MTDRQTDIQTNRLSTRLLELLRAAKKNRPVHVIHGRKKGLQNYYTLLQTHLQLQLDMKDEWSLFGHHLPQQSQSSYTTQVT